MNRDRSEAPSFEVTSAVMPLTVLAQRTVKEN